MKLLVIICLSFSLISCNLNKTDFKGLIEKPIDPQISIKLDRDEVRKLNASTHLISTKIKELVFDTTQSLKVEDIKNARINFINNKGDSIEIRLEQVIDTLYYINEEE